MQNSKDGDGTHWVCFKYAKNIVTYYDSFGVAPPREIMKICKKQLIYNNRQIQDENSTCCGWFCIACIVKDHLDLHGDPITHYNRFLSSFSDNTAINDKILKKMLVNYHIL